VELRKSNAAAIAPMGAAVLNQGTNKSELSIGPIASFLPRFAFVKTC
jgi:hypothetical protein